MTQRSSAIRWRWLVLVAYVAMVGAIVALMLHARQSALANLNTPQSIGEWQDWRDDAVARGDRREPKSAEPPGLVLMRDFFTVCLTGAIFFTTLLYWVLAWLIAGMLRTQQVGHT